MDLDRAIHVLSFNRHEKRPEPFKRTIVSTDPEEVDFPKSCLSLWVIHPVPDTLQNRCEWCHTNPSAYQYGYLILEHVLRRTSERSVDIHSWQDFTNGWIDVHLRSIMVDAHNSRTFRKMSVLEVTSNGCSESLGEVADTANVDRDVVFFWGACEGERMVLPYGDLGTAE